MSEGFREMPYLIQKKPQERILHLIPPSISIGSAEVNDIVVSSDLVSRRHAVIERVGGHWKIKDLDSTNGTYVNHIVVSSEDLHPGDLVALGDAAFHFVENPDDPLQIDFESKTAEIAPPVSRSNQSLFKSLLSSISLSGILGGQKQKKTKFDKAQERFMALLEISKALNSLTDLDQLQFLTLEITLRAVSARRGFIFIEENGFLYLKIGATCDGLVADIDNLAAGIAAGCFKNRDIAVSADPGRDPGITSIAGAAAEKAGSLACIPLRKGDACLGMVYVDTACGDEPLGDDDLGFLKGYCELLSSTLVSFGLRLELLRKNRAEEELAIAAQIQKNLYPKQAPVVKGFDIYGRNIPAKEIGGDYFDFFLLDEEIMVLTICDVSGKGLPAGMVATMIRAIIRSHPDLCREPAVMMEKLNESLCRDVEDGLYATIFFSVLDIPSRSLTYCSCGHEPAIISKPGNPVLRRLALKGMPVGMFEEASYCTETIQLKFGERLVMYTDGVVDIENPDGEPLGMEKFENFVQESVASGPRDFFNETFEILREYQGNAEQADDITMIVVDVLMPFARPKPAED